jgi:hypothetical protein
MDVSSLFCPILLHLNFHISFAKEPCMKLCIAVFAKFAFIKVTYKTLMMSPTTAVIDIVLLSQGDYDMQHSKSLVC